MKFYLYICFALLLFQCSPQKNVEQNQELWNFKPQNNQSNFDQACMPLLMQYQELLKGVASNDTNYIGTATKNLVQLTDSFPTSAISFKDNSLNEQVKNSLTNTNAELRGLLAEPNSEALHMATHMVSIQLLNLLAMTGFKEKSIYIFSVEDENFEDGLIWFGWNKKSTDPYHFKNKTEILAYQFLQEP